MRVRQLEIPLRVLEGGTYIEDSEARGRFQDWIRQLWAEKDELIGRLLAQARDPSDTSR